jgi:FlaA1/EpsC-like NDP-sugar epimerase
MDTVALLPSLLAHWFVHPNQVIAKQMATWALRLEQSHPPITQGLPKLGIDSVLIVGTGKLAHLLAWDVTATAGLTLIGFMDQNPEMSGLTCLDLPVYSNCQQAPLSKSTALLLSIEGEHDQALLRSLQTAVAQQGLSSPVLSWKHLLAEGNDEA